MNNVTVNRAPLAAVLGLVFAAVAIRKLAPELDGEVLAGIVVVIVALLREVVSFGGPKDPPSSDGGTGPDGKAKLTLISGGLLALLVVGACREKPPEFPTADEALYQGRLIACVAESDTLAQSQACRCAVNKAYGRPCNPELPDAGQDE